MIFKFVQAAHPKVTHLQFTFQSGDIQIDNGVELKILPNAFTFQSGDIQIEYTRDIIVKRLAFTFQSGDIQIKTFSRKTRNTIFIYIPIW